MRFRNRQPRAERLGRIPLFATCTKRQLARIDSLATELTVQPGYVMQREAGATSAFYVLVNGQATVSVAGRCVGHLHAGCFFGEVGLLDRGPSATTVTTATTVDVLVFSFVEFRALLENAPAAAMMIMRAHGLHNRGAGSDVMWVDQQPTARAAPDYRPPVYDHLQERAAYP